MRNRLIIDGNAVYEIDDECVKNKKCISDDAKDDFDIDRYMNFADSSFNTVRNAECLKKTTTTSGTWEN